MPRDIYSTYAASYSKRRDASVDYRSVDDLHQRLGRRESLDATVIVRGADGKVELEERNEARLRNDLRLGERYGLALGVVTALYPSVCVDVDGEDDPAVRAFLVTRAARVVEGMPRCDLKDLGVQLDRGSAGLVVVAAPSLAEDIRSVMSKAERIVERQLNLE